MSSSQSVVKGAEEEKEAPLRLCAWPEELEGNCILSVEGTEVHVNKTYLSMHSPVFHCMFNSDFKERSTDRYEVNEIDADAFIDMLRVILPSRKPIDERNVESLLVIADRFMMDNLRNECISFLCSDTEAAKSISCVVLIVLAFRYGVDELKARVSARLYTHDRVISLRHCPRFNEINDEARAWLFNVIIARPASTPPPVQARKVLCNNRCNYFDCICDKSRKAR